MKSTAALFRALVVVAPLAFGILSAAPASAFSGPVGLQLYSLRAQFKKDVPGTLDEIKSWHVKYAESYGDLLSATKMKPEEFKAQCDARGIKLIGSHFGYEQFRDDIDGVIRDAKAMGLKYAGCAWVPHKGPFTEQACRDTAAVFNRAGEALAKHGIKFFYHVHGYEFQPYKDGTLLDLLMQETNPKYVHYEMDVFWIVFPGQDPVKLLEKYGKRWELMHLKDMKKGTPTGSLTGGTDVNNDVALGAGQIDMAAILHTAKKTGVKWYFIEDESSSSETQIPESLQWLKQVK
jgi:sugar phosphate isomerase/epimerase